MNNKENEPQAGTTGGTPTDKNEHLIRPSATFSASEAEKGMGEQIFLDSLLEFTRKAKESPVAELAVAARRWEGLIGFRIKLTMQDRDRRKRNGDRRGLKQCRSTGLAESRQP